MKVMKVMKVSPRKIPWSTPIHDRRVPADASSRPDVLPLFEEDGIRFYFESVTYDASDAARYSHDLSSVLKAIHDRAGNATIVSRAVTDTCDGVRHEDYELYEDVFEFFTAMSRYGWLLTFVAAYDDDLYIDCRSGMTDPNEMTCCLRIVPDVGQRYLSEGEEGLKEAFDLYGRKIGISADGADNEDDPRSDGRERIRKDAYELVQSLANRYVDGDTLWTDNSAPQTVLEAIEELLEREHAIAISERSE